MLLAGSWSTVVSVVNTNFTANNASTRGAAMVLLRSRGTINDSHFTDNMASRSGAAISAFFSCVNVTSSTFERNNALAWKKPSFDAGFGSLGNGGACFLGESHATIHSCHFLNNTALQGGAVWVGSINRSSMGVNATNIYNTTFESNAAAQGGALALVGALVEMHDVRFMDNDASLTALQQADRVYGMLKKDYVSLGLGGGIYHSSSNVTMRDSKFHNNTAALDGGELTSSCFRGGVCYSGFTAGRYSPG